MKGKDRKGTQDSCKPAVPEHIVSNGYDGFLWETSNIGVGPIWTDNGQTVETDYAYAVLPKSIDRQHNYWISCSYRYMYKTQTLEIVVRQTGIQPEASSKPSFSKLKMDVQLERKWKWKQNCVLMKSKKDTRFRSTTIVFADVPYDRLHEMNLRLSIVGHFGLLYKSTLCRWLIPLGHCTSSEQTEFKKCSF